MPDRRSVAGIALRGGRVLVLRRLPGGDVGGLWEFPGGKVEPGEDPRAALAREWDEELALTVEAGAHLGSGSFVHRGETYELLAFSVEGFDGEMVLREHDESAWVLPSELDALDMVPSDKGILPVLWESGIFRSG